MVDIDDVHMSMQDAVDAFYSLRLHEVATLGRYFCLCESVLTLSPVSAALSVTSTEVK